MKTSEDIKGLIGKAQRGDRGAFDQIVLRCTEHIRARKFDHFTIVWTEGAHGFLETLEALFTLQILARRVPFVLDIRNG